jgi:hypothetical protein
VSEPQDPWDPAFVNKYFGEPWDAPFIADAQRVATPVGEPCIICQEPIVAGEQGMVTPLIHSGEDGTLRSRPAANHRGCSLLSTIGHMAGTCMCRPGLGSVRQRGLATVAWLESGAGGWR